MHEKIRRLFTVCMLSLCLFWSLAGSAAFAQEPSPRLFITNVDASTPPTVVLNVYGMDDQGNALDFSQESLSVRHDGAPAGAVGKIGSHTSGTFTLFLVDIPNGVSQQFPAIQDAIIQYASSPTMMEQVDYAAVYQVGETAAIELLAPNTFYHGVRNLFSAPLVAASGATALIDSTMGVLNQMSELKPDPAMAASLVVITDGTDAVSTRYEPDEVATRAADLGIPIHTIWLNNQDLSTASQEHGKNYLQEVAAGSRGLSVWLENSPDLPQLWRRVASFRDQSQIQYTIADIVGGTFPIEVSLMGSPNAKAESTVTIADNTPTVSLNLPPESRVLTLPDLDDPVKLRLSTAISWLDGVERQLTAAQLIINQTPQSIPLESIASFEVELSNLFFGDNALQISILDEQEIRVTSPIILLTIMEGSKSIPDDLKPVNNFGRIVGTIFLWLLILGAVGGLGFLSWHRGWFALLSQRIPRGRAQPQRQNVMPDNLPPIAPYAPDEEYEGPAELPVVAYLDVLGSVSMVPAHIPLNRTHLRIGRSPIQTDISFEDDITVSRTHASLMLEGSHYRIFDEGSTSGTYVNEQQVPEYGIQLLNGDEIHLGAVHLRFRQA